MSKVFRQIDSIDLEKTAMINWQNELECLSSTNFYCSNEKRAVGDNTLAYFDAASMTKGKTLCIIAVNVSIFFNVA